MRNMFVAALLLLALTGCQDPAPAPQKPSGKLDPNAKIYISANKLPQSTPTLTRADGEQQLLTPREVVEKATTLNANIWSDMHIVGRRDIENERFKVDAVWAIDMEGKLTEEFITARDLYFDIRNNKGVATDTIAYIPNAVMAAAERAIRAAYAEENYAECYRILEESFVFTPTMGAIFKELKAKGEN